MGRIWPGIGCGSLRGSQLEVEAAEAESMLTWPGVGPLVTGRPPWAMEAGLTLITAIADSSWLSGEGGETKSGSVALNAGPTEENSTSTLLLLLLLLNIVKTATERRKMLEQQQKQNNPQNKKQNQKPKTRNSRCPSPSAERRRWKTKTCLLPKLPNPWENDLE